jgi:YlmC/YmxH family sporulation protein
MRLSELNGKEIVNLYDGARMGIIGNCDLVIDENTGKIIYVLIPNRKTILFSFGERSSSEVSWDAIKKIGPDIVILEIQNSYAKKVWKL